MRANSGKEHLLPPLHKQFDQNTKKIRKPYSVWTPYIHLSVSICHSWPGHRPRSSPSLLGKDCTKSSSWCYHEMCSLLLLRGFVCVSKVLQHTYGYVYMLFSTQMWTPAACASLWTDVKQLQNRSHVAVVRLLYFWIIFIPKLTAAMSFLHQRRLISCYLQDKQWKNINKIMTSYKEQCQL